MERRRMSKRFRMERDDDKDDEDYHWEDGDLATCSWKVLTTCTYQNIDRHSQKERSNTGL
jgi:hypothetical protein